MDMSLAQEPTKAQLAYLAGFFDGEGTIGSNNRGRLYVSISQKYNTAVLEWLVSVYGGRLYKNSRQVVRWALSGMENIELFLADIFPFLVIKKDQVELALEWCETRNLVGQHLSPEVKEKRERIAVQLSELKTKYVRNGKEWMP